MVLDKEAMAEETPKSNRLSREKSPYLLQHAKNPVDWFPWGNEAFARAKELDRPIFLSIGYATCHWCHVMERESFEDPDVAKILNEIFVCVKVDREELPDVDSLYMEFAQSMMSGNAGWPLNVVLTPDLEPFFATTYMPPIARHGLLGIIEMAKRIQTIWKGAEKGSVVEKAERIVEAYRQNVHTMGTEIPEDVVIENSVALIYKLADPIWGGMRGVPKFPIGYQYNFMTREACLTKDSRPLFFVQRTLEMMHRGGIYDHLGGGFSRYSVDEKWLIPHFEKMLYDNAILMSSYLEGYLATKNDEYLQVATEIADFLLREMVHEKGGFYSAIDAESEGKEGYFYTWTYEEIVSILGADEGALLLEYYGVTPAGNFDGRNVLHVDVPFNEFASRKGIDPKLLRELFALQKKTLLEVRSLRKHPIKDDKILTSWNGLVIASLAELGNHTGKHGYVMAAKKAASFILSTMVSEGLLHRRWREGETKWKASLDDYAFFIKGLLCLFEADGERVWLEAAIKFADLLEMRFKQKDGAFFQTEVESSLLIRKCQFADGAEPSGNAVHAENLLRLFQLTTDPHYLAQAEDIFRAVKKFLDAYPPGYCYHVMALQRYYDEKAAVAVIALNESEDYIAQLQSAARMLYHPHAVVLFKRDEGEDLSDLIPSLEGKEAVGGKTTLYVCLEGSCSAPITSLDEMLLAIHQL